MAETLGLSLSDLGSQVRDAFYGVEAQRIQRNGDEVKVMVRYPSQERKSLADLDNTYIRTSSGDAVPFYAVADLESKKSYASINKINGKLAVNISAKIDKRYYNPDAVSAQIMKSDLPKLVETYPSIRFETDGDSKEGKTRQRFSARFCYGNYCCLCIARNTAKILLSTAYYYDCYSF